MIMCQGLYNQQFLLMYMTVVYFLCLELVFFFWKSSKSLRFINSCTKFLRKSHFYWVHVQPFCIITCILTPSTYRKPQINSKHIMKHLQHPPSYYHRGGLMCMHGQYKLQGSIILHFACCLISNKVSVISLGCSFFILAFEIVKVGLHTKNFQVE